MSAGGKESVVVEIAKQTERPFISAHCFDCHLEQQPDELVTTRSASERQLKNVRQTVKNHGRGHRVFVVVGRKP